MPPSSLRTWAEAVAGLVWPRVCWLCDDLVLPDASDGLLCPTCRTAILTDPHQTCPQCSSTVGPHTDLANGCPRCRDTKFRFAGAVRLGPYDGLLREAVLRMKASSGEPLAETLGRVWVAERVGQLGYGGPNAVVPVPLHWRRRWGRGYNQSNALARGVADGLGIPCLPSALIRTRATPTQRALPSSERWENVKGVFRTGRSGVKGMTILLVDDVMTTGATADAASAALMTAGAAQVRLAVVAHG